MTHRRRRAFTLIELLGVIAIIAILLAILMPYIGGQGDQDYREMGIHNCHLYPNREQTLDYVIDS